MMGRVLFVGVGPGDPELLTLKALRCLQEADVVLADRLIPPGLSNYASGAEWISVGKHREGGTRQDDINRLLVEHALKGKTVVRLKGGDPLLFSRAEEELDACRRNDIPVEIVPGISAFQAAAAAAKTPLTTRHRNPWLVLVPGHQSPDAASGVVPWDLVASTGGTLAVYMGVSNLSTVQERLLQAGRSDETPVTLVANASCKNERVLETRLGHMAEDAKRAGIESPALLLVHQGLPLNLFSKTPMFPNGFANVAATFLEDPR